MAKSARKEKYISAQKNGQYLLVKFTYNVGHTTKTYTKTFNVSDYRNYTEAMKAACKHRDIKRAELLSGFVEEQKLTLDEVHDIYISRKHMAHNTLMAFETNYTKYIQPDHGNRYVSDITALEIEESMAKIRDKKSNEVLCRINNVWASLIGTARKLRVIKYNIMEEVEIPKSRYYPEERTKKVTTDEDIQTVLSALSQTAVHATRELTRYNARILSYMIIVCRNTGIRPAEAYALRREVIDFYNHTLTIDCMYGSDEHGKAIVSAKTSTSVRTIPLTLAAEMALKGAMSMSANEYVFMQYNGKLFNNSAVQNTMKRAGVDGMLSLYTLRHQFSSDMITGGVDPRTVMELMGHKNLSMTVGTYARSTDEIKRNALEELGRRNSENADNHYIN